MSTCCLSMHICIIYLVGSILGQNYSDTNDLDDSYQIINGDGSSLRWLIILKYSESFRWGGLEFNKHLQKIQSFCLPKKLSLQATLITDKEEQSERWIQSDEYQTEHMLHWSM